MVHGEGGVDRFIHGGHAPGPLGRFRFVEGNAGIADLLLRANEALAHGRRGDQKSARDTRRIEPENGLQHERRTNRFIDGRVCAHQQQAEAQVALLGGLLRQFDQRLLERDENARIRRHGAVACALPALVLRHGQQPRLGRGGNARRGPPRERLGKRIAECIFRRRDIAEAYGQRSNEPPIRFACNASGRRGRILGHVHQFNFAAGEGEPGALRRFRGSHKAPSRPNEARYRGRARR